MKHTVALSFFFSCAFLAASAQVSPGSSVPAALIEQFKTERVFTDQFEVAEKLVKLHDTAILESLRPYLQNEDRHARGNAAFVFAALGYRQGFEVIVDILRDRSNRRMGQYNGGNWTLAAQITADRYYAAHLLGDLKDARSVPILVPLLKDKEVNWIVPWALGEIGDKSAIPPLIETLDDKSPDMRVLAIYALEALKATQALPKLRLLVDDDERIHFDGLRTVGEAVKEAIAVLDPVPRH
jgi:HEAT repeat protein